MTPKEIRDAAALLEAYAPLTAILEKLRKHGPNEWFGLHTNLPDVTVPATVLVSVVETLLARLKQRLLDIDVNVT